MKFDFLKTLQAVQPCGLRPIIEPLSDSYPVMAFSDWKELAFELMDGGFVSRQGNGQYRVTPAGAEAIEKGASFLEVGEEDAAPEGAEAAGSAVKTPHKRDSMHPWKQPLFTKKQLAGESPMNPAGYETPKVVAGNALQQEEHETEPVADSEDELDGLAESLSASVNRPIEDMSTDDLLGECRLSKDLISSLSQRRCSAVREIQRRMEDL